MELFNSDIEMNHICFNIVICQYLNMINHFILVTMLRSLSRERKSLQKKNFATKKSFEQSLRAFERIE